MVYTLHRYIFLDLLKKFALGLIVLSLVMGLGMMLKPLRSYNIDPMKVPTLIAYTMPITITMVMPIAALLATTLTYGRLAFDNEINACRSSGISVISLIYPAGTLALLIGLVSLLLGFHTIPYFISKFENIITEDAEAMIFRGIEKKGEISKLFSGMVIQADRVWPEQKILQGVTLVIADKERVKQVITASAVKLNIESEPTGQNNIHLQIVDGRGLFDDAYVELSRQGFSLPIPTMFKDKIKFKDLDELKQISADPSHFGPINQNFKSFRDQYIQEALFNYADNELRRTGVVSFNCDNGRIVRVFAAGCSYKADKLPSGKDTEFRAEFIASASGVITVEYSDPGNALLNKVYRCEQAGLKTETLYGNTSQTALYMKNASWQTGDGRSVNHSVEGVSGLIIPSEILELGKSVRLSDFTQMDKNEIVMPSYASPRLNKMSEKLWQLCRALLIEIAAEKHSRLAFGVSCVILTVMGAALGIIFKSGHLLTAFGISFIPAAFCLITMFSGKHVAENSANLAGGLLFMWSGVLLVTILTLFLYRGLTRS
ncbi:MAG: LptF/LptG family permease [Sedimentisphaerales bacterium]|nr:LptF/LptG family permease [Sedimentisphaerales bacterium]